MPGVHRLALLGSLLVPLSVASAAEPAPYFTAKSEQVLGVDDFDYDSDWQPAGSPIQVRLIAHAANTVSVEMDGAGEFDWTMERLSFEGTEDGGEFAIDAGLDVSAQVRFDIATIQWTGDLMDPFLYGVFESVLFDPYLLEGNPDRPAIIDTDLPRETLADVPIGIDLIVASGTLHIEIGGHIHAELYGEEIAVEAPAGPGSATTVDGLLIDANPAETLEVDASLRTLVVVDMTFLLYPSVVLEVLGTPYTLAEFELPVELGEQELGWWFDAVPLSFEPPPAEEGDDDDDGGIQGDVGDAPDRGRALVSGCECSTGRCGGAAGGLLALVAVTGLGLRQRMT